MWILMTPPNETQHEKEQRQDFPVSIGDAKPADAVNGQVTSLS